MDAYEQDTISAMLSNGSRISRLTEYIGLFEWLLFAWYWKCRVIVHMGSQLIDVVKLMLESKYDEHLQLVQDASFERAVHVAWCSAYMSGEPLMVSSAWRCR